MDERARTVVTELRERLDEIYGDRLVCMILFGSRARGDASPGSDIDVLVVLRGPVNAAQEVERTGAVVSGISLGADEVVSCIFVDDQQYRHRNGPFLRNVRREGVTL
jgi:uncharacterized protein